MSSVFAWPVVVTLAAGVGTLSLISYLIQYRDKPGAKWFILTLCGQATFCFAYGIGLTQFDPTIRYWLEILAFIGLSWLGVPFLGFALGYTGRGSLLQSWIFKVLLSFPLVSTVLLPLNEWHHLFLSGFEIDPVYGVATASYSLTPLAFFGVLGASVVVGIGAVVLFDTVVSYGPLYRGEALAVALSPVPPIAGFLPWLFGFGPAPQLNTASLGLLPHVILDMYAFVGSGMFKFYPATNRAAERSTVDDLDSPVLFLEEKGRIVSLNESAERVLGLDGESAITEPISTVLDGRIQLDRIENSTEPAQLSTRHDGRQREFLLESSLLTDSSGNHVGYTLLFQDITEAVRREERLSVLNRVLRHNLRNDLTVIETYIDEARRQTDDTAIEDLLENGKTKVKDLTSAGETAREIEETIGTANTSATSQEPGAVLDSLTRRAEQLYPKASVSITTEVESVETDWSVLESVLWELLENGIVHNDESPEVSVSVTPHEEGVDCSVADDGSGIPDHEVDTLQSGEESALEHGSGLGLWLVKWGAMRLGADLSFETGDSGTTVHLLVPTDSRT